MMESLSMLMKSMFKTNNLANIQAPAILTKTKTAKDKVYVHHKESDTILC